MSISVIILFQVISSAWSIWTRYQRKAWYDWAKPIPIVFLLILLILAQIRSNNIHDTTTIYIIIGLILGLLGDILLLRERWFLIGLFAFLSGHLLYMIAWWPQHIQMPWHYFFFYTIGFFYWINLIIQLRKKKRTKYIIPSLLYALIISSMFLLAANFEFNNQQFHYFIIGAFLFCVSDAILGWEKFIQSFPFAHIFILTTYYGAQTFIALGALNLLNFI